MNKTMVRLPRALALLRFKCSLVLRKREREWEKARADKVIR